MLLLCLRKIGSMAEAKFLPAGDTVGLVPSRGLWRAEEHSFEWTYHGVSVEGRVRLGKRTGMFFNARHQERPYDMASRQRIGSFLMGLPLWNGATNCVDAGDPPASVECYSPLDGEKVSVPQIPSPLPEGQSRFIYHIFDLASMASARDGRSLGTRVLPSSERQEISTSMQRW